MEQKSIGFTVWSSHTGDSCWLCLTLYNLEWPPIMTRCSIVAFSSGVWAIVPPDLQGCCTPKKKKMHAHDGKEEGCQKWQWERVGEFFDHDFCLCWNKDIDQLGFHSPNSFSSAVALQFQISVKIFLNSGERKYSNHNLIIIANSIRLLFVKVTVAHECN